MFEPRVREEIDAFRALYRSAESETVPFTMFFGARAAQNYAARGEFIAAVRFGEALHPSNMEKLSGVARAELAMLPAKINEARSMASIFIDCPVDFESNVAGTLTRLLSYEGLSIAASPSLAVKITGTRSEPLFSCAASPDRQAAATADVAKRRAYSALAAALESGFIAELSAR